MQSGVTTQSLQEKVREARKVKQANAIIKVPLPNYGGMLVGIYHPVDWKTKGTIELAHADVEDPLDKILLQQADYLLAASRSVEVVDGEEHQDLQKPLGRALADYLGVDLTHVETDRQALLQIIDDGGELIEHSVAVLNAQQAEDHQIDEKLVGESEAVS